MSNKRLILNPVFVEVKGGRRFLFAPFDKVYLAYLSALTFTRPCLRRLPPGLGVFVPDSLDEVLKK